MIESLFGNVRGATLRRFGTFARINVREVSRTFTFDLFSKKWYTRRNLEEDSLTKSTGEIRMIRLTKISILIITIIFGCSTTHGQTTSDSPALLRSKVEFLVGSFTTSTNMPPPSTSMPKGATGTGTSVITWALDSMFLSIEEESVNS